MASLSNLAWVITSGSQDSQEICRILAITPHRCYNKGALRAVDNESEALLHPFTTVIFGLKDDHPGKRIELQMAEAIQEVQTLKERLKGLITPYCINLHCRLPHGSGVALTGEQITQLSLVGAGICVDLSPPAD